MASNNQNSFVKDLANNKVVVTHYCDADIDTVWEMWTQPELIELWWGPKPWRAETVKMNFEVGGQWHYAMVGPNNERGYSLLKYREIVSRKSIGAIAVFSDEKGTFNPDAPQTEWRITFDKSNEGVKVTVSIVGNGVKMMVDMGFEQGFTIGLGQLDEELAKADK